jgi:hypothetical protein
MIFDRVIKCLIGWLIGWRMGPTGLIALGSLLFRLGVDTALAPFNHSLT